MIKKYFKPFSLTWWSGIVPLTAGLVLATEPLHGVASITAVIYSATGGIQPSVMIAYGLTAIGLRGKDDLVNK